MPARPHRPAPLSTCPQCPAAYVSHARSTCLPRPPSMVHRRAHACTCIMLTPDCRYSSVPLHTPCACMPGLRGRVAALCVLPRNRPTPPLSPPLQHRCALVSLCLYSTRSPRVRDRGPQLLHCELFFFRCSCPCTGAASEHAVVGGLWPRVWVCCSTSHMPRACAQDSRPFVAQPRARGCACVAETARLHDCVAALLDGAAGPVRARPWWRRAARVRRC